MLRKEESAFDTLQDEIDVIRPKLQNADDDYDDLVKENENLLDERRQATEDLEKLSERREKLQLESINSAYEVLDKTKELNAAKGQISELQKQLDGQLASPSTEDIEVASNGLKEAKLFSTGDEMEVPVGPATTDRETKGVVLMQSSLSNFGSQTSLDAAGSVTSDPLQKFEMDPSLDCKKELLDCNQLSVQTQIVPEFKMSVEGKNHVALPTAEAEVKQPRPGSDATSDSESVGEVVIPENKHDPTSQANVLDARTENERFIPAAVEQSHNAYSSQAGVYEDEEDLQGRNREFDADADAFFECCTAKPALNASAPTFMPAFVSDSTEPTLEKESVVSDTDKGATDYAASCQDEAPKVPAQQTSQQPIESSECTEKPVKHMEKQPVKPIGMGASRWPSVPLKPIVPTAPSNWTDDFDQPIAKSFIAPDPQLRVANQRKSQKDLPRNRRRHL